MTMTAGSPLNLTWLLDATGSKPVPKRVTALPAGPAVGEKEEIARAGSIVKVIVPGRRCRAEAVTV